MVRCLVRSGLALIYGITAHNGVIDADYRGVVYVVYLKIRTKITRFCMERELVKQFLREVNVLKAKSKKLKEIQMGLDQQVCEKKTFQFKKNL